MKKRVIAVILIVVLSMFTLSGCSMSSKERVNDDSNTLYVGYVGTSFPTSFMPWQSRDGIAPTLSSMIYSTLFSLDDLTGEFLPNLAKDWCYVDPDGNPIVTPEGDIDYERLDEIYSKNTYSYIPVKVTIFDNAKWSDGERVTVEDLFFTYDLCANSSMSNHAGALAWVTDLNHEYTSGINTTYGIYTKNHNPGNKYSFTEEEKDTVIYLHTNKVLGAVTSLFTTVLIIPQHRYAPIISSSCPINNTNPPDNLRYEYQHPVGCGPYALDTDNSNAQTICLKRREDYHMMDKHDSSKPLYKVDTIKFILYQEENVAIFSLLKGYVDVLSSSISPNYKILFEKEKDIQLLSANNPFVMTLVINLNAPTAQKNEMRSLLEDIEFRKAIALSIDQEFLIKSVLNGTGTTYSPGLVSSELVDIYNDNADPNKGKTTELKIKEANEILDKKFPEKDSLGYRLFNGRKIEFEITTGPAQQDLVSFLQVGFQKIGIDVKYAACGSTPENTYYYVGKFDMTLQGVTFTESIVDLMMVSHFVTLNKSSNYGRLIDNNLQTEIEEMRTTLNKNLKYEKLKHIQELIANEYYKIPLYSAKVLSVARTDRYTGWVEVAGQTAFTTDSLENLKRVGK